MQHCTETNCCILRLTGSQTCKWSDVLCFFLWFRCWCALAGCESTHLIVVPVMLAAWHVCEDRCPQKNPCWMIWNRLPESELYYYSYGPDTQQLQCDPVWLRSGVGSRLLKRTRPWLWWNLFTFSPFYENKLCIHVVEAEQQGVAAFLLTLWSPLGLTLRLSIGPPHILRVHALLWFLTRLPPLCRQPKAGVHLEEVCRRNQSPAIRC